MKSSLLILSLVVYKFVTFSGLLRVGYKVVLYKKSMYGNNGNKIRNQ